jgi:ribonuclease P protein component
VLAKASRLRNARDIARVYKRGTYGASGGVLSVKAAPSGRSHARLVVVVPKKVDKRAVIRNRIRRRLLGSIGQNLATLGPGYDIVISVHRDVSEFTTQALSNHLMAALQKAGVIKG